MPLPLYTRECVEHYEDTPDCADCAAGKVIKERLDIINQLLEDVCRVAKEHGFGVGVSKNMIGQLDYDCTDTEGYYGDFGWIESGVCQ